MSEVASTHPVTNSTFVQKKFDKNLFGFWVYIMTDCVLFASLFATYAVLNNNTNGGPDGRQLFSLPYILTETIILLTSSFTCGLAILAARHNHKTKVVGWFTITFLLGLAFLIMELVEFTHLAHTGNSWTRSGFLSSYFALVGTHGLHISVGLLWMLVLIVRVAKSGLKSSTIRRLTMLSLFWHFLDIIWIFIFTIVYLRGAVQG
ncbi:MAG TPA: cytochrome o ubiquinol oxidase subunit III [Candidatus Saccharimonadales bacterium]|nr:cytochrome o ubiquinol oxidase subunit III [Candidatus Saccharimonadales bacterium]